MGLFHNTIKEIEKVARTGDLHKAYQILDEHIKKDNMFDSDLMGLQQAIGAYQHQLRILHGCLLECVTLPPKEWSSPTQERKKELIDMIRDAEFKLNVIKDHMKHLLKDEKFILK